MSDKLEQSMKKIHIYLANCKESPYSGEELIVSKKRIFSLLEELNYAVYDAMEEYEQTVASRDRGLAQVERRAADIKEDARKRSEEIYASSLLYTQKAVTDVKRVAQFMHDKIRTEYEALLADYEERINLLEKDSQEIVLQLQAMGDSKIYLRMIEEMKEKSRQMEENAMAEESVSNSKKVGSVTSAEAYAEPQDEYESKLAASIVVEVHDTPKIPEGFGKGRRKKKGKQAPGGEVSVTSQELDAEYFAFQEEQQQALAEQMAEEAETDAEDGEESGGMFKEALKLFSFGNKKGNK